MNAEGQRGHTHTKLYFGYVDLEMLNEQFQKGVVRLSLQL